MSSHLLKAIQRTKGMPSMAQSRYSTLSAERNNFLDRAKEYSRFTLPYILPDETDMSRGGGANQHGFQGIGSQAVNHLSNKLTINLFPTGRSFFSLQFDEEMKARLKEAGYNPTQLQELLVAAEKRCSTYQQKVAARTAYNEMFKNLLISGNVLAYLPKKGALQAIKLDRYALKRDLSGELIELCIVQKKTFDTLSEDVREGIKAIKGLEAPKDDDVVEIYTWVLHKGDDVFCVTQAVNGVTISDVQEIKKADLPWIPLRWNSTYGEDYGRGHVEDHAGDFYVIEFLSEAIAKGMALMADIKYLVRPGSQTDIDEVASAPAGEWVFGSLDDIGVLQLERFADFTPISEVLNKYERRIGQAFLLNSAVRRDAERVTTLELRLDAQELEISLGGVYSLLAQTMQTPLAYLYLKRVGFPLEDEAVVPNIVTGLDSLGKAGDLDKIKQYTEMMQMPQAWPEAVQKRTKFDIYSREVAASLSLELPWQMTDDEWKEYQEEIKQSQQEGAMQEAAVKAAPQLLKQAQGQGGNANE